MEDRNEKLESLLESLKERNMTLEDLKTSHEEYSEDEEDIELLDDESDNDEVEDYIDTTSSTVTLREDDSKEVDLDDFF